MIPAGLFFVFEHYTIEMKTKREFLFNQSFKD